MKGEIEGVIIHPLQRHEDERGWLTELVLPDELEAEFHPAMSYVSMTKPGVARGPHEHTEQTDCFGFIGPSTFRLYLWDNRVDSPTHGAKATFEFGRAKPALVLIPPGVVHAYRNIGEEDGLVYNAPDRLYAGEGRQEEVDEIRHEDAPGSPFALD